MSTSLNEDVSVPVDGESRRLATVEVIQSVTPILNADAIVSVKVRGWNTVVKLEEFQVGDLCVYFEVDSLLDVSDPRFDFLASRGVREDSTGRSGHVLKTMKLRGVYSQGLALPLASFPELVGVSPGDDVTSKLGVVKWDPPIPEELRGKVRGVLPSWFPATFENRIQNFPEVLTLDLDSSGWVATEKLDGTSTSVYVDPISGTLDAPILGVCSRNYDLSEEAGSALWQTVKSMNLHRDIQGSWPSCRVVVQGETFGLGVPPNALRLSEQLFRIFTIRVDGVELPRSQWPDWALKVAVPVVEGLSFPSSLEQALEDVDGMSSVFEPKFKAEGVVWRHLAASEGLTPSGESLRASFKVISNRYLLKNDR